jgi:hypothetical protein
MEYKMTKLTRKEIMGRASFFRSDGKMILKYDLSGLETDEEVQRVVKYFRSLVSNMPKKSLVGLADFKGLRVTEVVTQELIHLAEACSPYFRATATIANDDVTIGLANAVVNHFGKINMPIYQEEEPAKEWLFTQ